LNPSAAVSGLGVILNVASNSIVVRHEDGHNVKLHLGACTRIESSSELP